MKVSADCSSKRLERSVKKIMKFIEFSSKTLRKNYICPLFLSHLQLFDLGRMNKYNNLAGYTILTEDYKKLSFTKVLAYKEAVSNLNIPNETMLIKCGTGHPSKENHLS